MSVKNLYDNMISKRMQLKQELEDLESEIKYYEQNYIDFNTMLEQLVPCFLEIINCNEEEKYELVRYELICDRRKCGWEFIIAESDKKVIENFKFSVWKDCYKSFKNYFSSKKKINIKNIYTNDDIELEILGFPYIEQFLCDLSEWRYLNKSIDIPDEVICEIKNNYLKKDVKQKKLIK